jgi:hypothetical protein
MIYFIQVGRDGPIKIGATRYPVEQRCAAFQTGNPYPLRVFGTIEGNHADEAELHRRFAKDWIRGEWFLPSDALVAFICTVCDYTPLPGDPEWVPASLLDHFGRDDARRIHADLGRLLAGEEALA